MDLELKYEFSHVLGLQRQVFNWLYALPVTHWVIPTHQDTSVHQSTELS